MSRRAASALPRWVPISGSEPATDFQISVSNYVILRIDHGRVGSQTRSTIGKEPAHLVTPHKGARHGSTRFDDSVSAAARRDGSRAALRLLAAGALGSMRPSRVMSGRAARRSDRDQDGLFDDDEPDVQGTNPDIVDPDGDDVGDGE